MTLPVIGVVVGAYTFINSLAPSMPIYASAPDETVKKLTATKPVLNENRLYIPKINLDIVAASAEGDEALALEKGAINRSPESGNPKDGGNYVLAAHRFQFGLTPWQTREKSPFYHIDKLSVGDEVYVDYEGVRYAFKIVSRKFVNSTATEETDKDQLTLYPSETMGSGAGSDVIIAERTGTIVWVNGSPKLKTL